MSIHNTTNFVAGFISANILESGLTANEELSWKALFAYVDPNKEEPIIWNFDDEEIPEHYVRTSPCLNININININDDLTISVLPIGDDDGSLYVGVTYEITNNDYPNDEIVSFMVDTLRGVEFEYPIQQITYDGTDFVEL